MTGLFVLILLLMMLHLCINLSEVSVKLYENFSASIAKVENAVKTCGNNQAHCQFYR
jgi:hypothetical protein